MAVKITEMRTISYSYDDPEFGQGSGSITVEIDLTRPETPYQQILESIGRNLPTGLVIDDPEFMTYINNRFDPVNQQALRDVDFAALKAAVASLPAGTRTAVVRLLRLIWRLARAQGLTNQPDPEE